MINKTTNVKSDCKYCSKSGNCLLHVGYKWHQRFLSPCVGENCQLYKKTTRRAEYKWGAKEYLSSMSIGDIVEWDGTYPWRSLSATACRLKKDYGCAFRLTTIEETKKKVIIRLA